MNLCGVQWTKSSRANFGGAIFDLFLLTKSIVLRYGTSLGPKLRTYEVGFSKFNKKFLGIFYGA